MNARLKKCAGAAGLLVAMAAAAPPAAGGGGPDAQGNLADMSIEQLMNESVTSVSKKETNLFASPAAVAVVTADDISRMDFTSLPEALRFVPGVDVARITGDTWAVSVRGDNSEFSNDTLVLIDGRTVYTPVYGGVAWRTQGIPMQDIDRIEVIRGPGSILWGANAMNGVVNVISKSAQETQGILTRLDEGTEDDPSVTVRYGGKAGDSVYYRAYVNYFNRNGLVAPDGEESSDSSHGWRSGFRVDAAPSERNSFTLEGDGYNLDTFESTAIPRIDLASNQVVDVTSGSRGEDLLGKWVRSTSEASQSSVQAFYAHDHDSLGVTHDTNDTFDIEAQERFPIGARNDVVSGIGYRFVRDDLVPSVTTVFSPQVNLIHIYGAFVQDQVALVPGRVSLIPGAKLEHNDVSGFEFEPGVRLLWTPQAVQTIWLGANRAVRTPALEETALQYSEVSAFPTSPGGPPGLVVVAGNPNIHRSETVDAFELGYRFQATRELSFDIAAFYNVFDDLIMNSAPVSSFAAVPPPPHLLVVTGTQSGGSGHSYGVEPSVTWRVTSGWRLSVDYSLFRSSYTPDDSEALESPRNMIHLRSYLDLWRTVELTGALSYIGRIVDGESIVPQRIPSYQRADIGLVWRPTPAFELGIWGQNLASREHLEFAGGLTPLIYEVPRGIATRITWRR